MNRWRAGLIETFEAVDEVEEDVCTEELGSARSSDTFGGDRRMRTLRTLLALIDDRGFERSSQQVEFHENFINACGRILCARAHPRAPKGAIRAHPNPVLHTGIEKTGC